MEKKKKLPTIVIVIIVLVILAVAAMFIMNALVVTETVSESKKASYQLTISSIRSNIMTRCQLADMSGKEFPSVITFENGEADYDIEYNGTLPDSGTITINDCEVETVDVKFGRYSVTKNADSNTIEVAIK